MGKQRQAELELERQRKAEEEKQRLAEEQRKAQEAEQKRLQEEAEKQRQAEIEAEKQRKAQEELEKQEAMEVDDKPSESKTLFKHSIIPKPEIPNIAAGPPPSSDDLESSPKKGPVPLMSLNLEKPNTAQEPQGSGNKDLRLPKALEEALSFKSQWASQVGVQPSDIARVEREGNAAGEQSVQVVK